jgi:hypothetical protein
MEKQIDNKSKALIAEVALTLLDCSKKNQNCVSLWTLAVSLYEKGLLRQPWHDVATDPPKTSGSYIISTDKGSVFPAHFYADCGRFNALFGKSVVYWMPFPKPPKGVAE